VLWKEVVCLWRVSGHEVPVKAVVAQVEGYNKRFTLVPSATGLIGLQVVELFCVIGVNYFSRLTTIIFPGPIGRS
jgi:hypothetical protein